MVPIPCRFPQFAFPKNTFCRKIPAFCRPFEYLYQSSVSIRTPEIEAEIPWQQTTSDSIKINFVKQQPSKGLVFIMHGFGSTSKRSTVVNSLVSPFFEEGYDVVTFDARGKSVANFERSLRKVVKWAETQDFPKGPFILCGHSLGGMTAMKYAHDFPDKVRAVVPVAIPMSKELAVESGVDLPRQKALGKVDLMKLATDIKTPTLLVVGDQDPDTRMKDHIAFFKRLKQGGNRLEIVLTQDSELPAKHSLKGPANVQTLQETVKDWIRDTLSP